MARIKLKVAAKININLKIDGKFNDGYHKLNMLNSSVDVFDEIEISKRLDNLINCFSDGKKADLKNTAYLAAKKITEVYNIGGVDIFIKKNIPYNAGLGGSSADAAGVIYGLNRIFEIEPNLQDLQNTALSIGSDVPYMLYGGLMKVLGRGEVLEKLNFHIDKKVLIIKGILGTSAKEVYQKYDRLKNKKAKEFEFLNFIFFNDLQKSAISICPEIKQNLRLLKNAGAKVFLTTGSGSAVYGVFESDEQLFKAYENLKDNVNYIKIAEFIDKGIFEIQ
jgi:4-diphosphocytidyl-2-C-methyl-D-erythritol kinase